MFILLPSGVAPSPFSTQEIVYVTAMSRTSWLLKVTSFPAFSATPSGPLSFLTYLSWSLWAPPWLVPISGCLFDLVPPQFPAPQVLQANDNALESLDGVTNLPRLQELLLCNNCILLSGLQTAHRVRSRPQRDKPQTQTGSSQGRAGSRAWAG